MPFFGKYQGTSPEDLIWKTYSIFSFLLTSDSSDSSHWTEQIESSYFTSCMNKINTTTYKRHWKSSKFFFRHIDVIISTILLCTLLLPPSFANVTVTNVLSPSSASTLFIPRCVTTEAVSSSMEWDSTNGRKLQVRSTFVFLFFPLVLILTSNRPSNRRIRYSQESSYHLSWWRWL